MARKPVSAATKLKIARSLKGNKNAFKGGPKKRLTTREKIANINAATKGKKMNLSSDQVARRQAVAKRLRAQARREEALGGGTPGEMKSNADVMNAALAKSDRLANEGRIMQAQAGNAAELRQALGKVKEARATLKEALPKSAQAARSVAPKDSKPRAQKVHAPSPHETQVNLKPVSPSDQNKTSGNPAKPPAYKHPVVPAQPGETKSQYRMRQQMANTRADAEHKAALYAYNAEMKRTTQSSPAAPAVGKANVASSDAIKSNYRAAVQNAQFRNEGKVPTRKTAARNEGAGKTADANGNAVSSIKSGQAANNPTPANTARKDSPTPPNLGKGGPKGDGIVYTPDEANNLVKQLKAGVDNGHLTDTQFSNISKGVLDRVGTKPTGNAKLDPKIVRTNVKRDQPTPPQSVTGTERRDLHSYVPVEPTWKAPSTGGKMPGESPSEYRSRQAQAHKLADATYKGQMSVYRAKLKDFQKFGDLIAKRDNPAKRLTASQVAALNELAWKFPGVIG